MTTFQNTSIRIAVIHSLLGVPPPNAVHVLEYVKVKELNSNLAREHEILIRNRGQSSCITISS